MSTTLVHRISAALRSLAASDAREARLVIEAGPIYLISIARRGRGALHQEAVASAALPAALKLSAERGQLLRDLGFKKHGGGRRNWQRSHARGEPELERIAVETVDLLTRVYGVDGAPSLVITEDDSEPPVNPDLLAAMRKVAKDRNEEVRRAMYRELVNATLLVPLVPEPGPEDPPLDDPEAFFAIETTSRGRPTFAGFTDWAALRLWKPRGWPYVPMHGSELFERALEHKSASFRVNPNGDVGGELYAHEIEMLAQAVRSFRRGRSN